MRILSSVVKNEALGGYSNLLSYGINPSTEVYNYNYDYDPINHDIHKDSTFFNLDENIAKDIELEDSIAMFNTMYQLDGKTYQTSHSYRFDTDLIASKQSSYNAQIIKRFDAKSNVVKIEPNAGWFKQKFDPLQGQTGTRTISFNLYYSELDMNGQDEQQKGYNFLFIGLENYYHVAEESGDSKSIISIKIKLGQR
jgi:hypothetical protein